MYPASICPEVPGKDSRNPTQKVTQSVQTLRPGLSGGGRGQHVCLLPGRPGPPRGSIAQFHSASAPHRLTLGPAGGGAIGRGDLSP